MVEGMFGSAQSTELWMESEELIEWVHLVTRHACNPQL